MQSSDAHLERALNEYNERINTLEDGPASVELVDALQKRGKVLSLMGYSTSAAEDFADAYDYLETVSLEEPVPADLRIRVYAAYGSIFRNEEPETMCEIYHEIAECVPDLKDPASCARVCLRCAEDLYDVEETHDCEILLGVALTSKDATDINGRNVYFGALRLAADLALDVEHYSLAAARLNDAAKVGASLLADSGLYDAETYAATLMDLCDCLMELGDKEAASANIDTLRSVLDDRQFVNRLGNKELSDIHGRIGKVLMELGRVPEAENHLLRQAAFSLGGDDAILRAAIEQKLDDRDGF